MEVYYLNSKNQKICFTEKPYTLLDGGSIFDYSLNYATSGKTNPKVKIFTNNLKAGYITVIVSGKTREEYCENINNLMDTIAYDVDNNATGKLYCGNQYCLGYFYGNEHGTSYNNSKRAELKLSFVAEKGGWVSEKNFSFARITNEAFNSDGLDYPYDYSYDYANNLVNQKIVNDNYTSSDFEMTIYGSCENPTISIGQHTYSVETSLITGEYLKINSSTKKVYKVKNNGDTINLFSKKGRDFYIFEKIPSGILNVAWSGGFGFDVKLLSERSEPKWI